jgi:hypothetical protein
MFLFHDQLAGYVFFLTPREISSQSLADFSVQFLVFGNLKEKIKVSYQLITHLHHSLNLIEGLAFISLLQILCTQALLS